MLKWEQIRPQYVVYQYHALRELPPERYGSSGSVHEKKPGHLPGRGMGPLSIVSCVSEDHRQIESCCDVGGRKYPWPAVNGKMHSSWVGLSPRRHRVIKLDDYPRIKITTRRHERLKVVSLHEDHGVLELRVLSKCWEIIVSLPVQISCTVVSIPGMSLQWK